MGIAAFIGIGGEVVMHLWNWLLPALVRMAANHPLAGNLGLLALCRILFGDLGMRARGPHRSNFRRRMAERWEHMTPEERERFRQSWRGRCGFGPSASENKAQ